jgi:hypothetical protein
MQITLLNSAVAMFNTGPSLLEHDDIKVQWSSSVDLRRAFLEDVGESALNLVETLCLCHNDIRLSNITFKENRFCLIDYDNCRTTIAPTFTNSPVMNGLNSMTKEASMMLSIAQIALVVFALETKKSSSTAWDVWLEGKNGTPTSFNRWVSETALDNVFTRQRTDREKYDRQFMDEQLRRMLLLQSAQSAP